MPRNTMALLHVNNVSHHFDCPLFNNVTLKLHEGKSLSIVGISGCGKSTLLHICSTLLKPKSGEIIYKNNSLYTLKKNELLQIRRDDMGIIFQSHYLFKGFSARENIELSTILAYESIDETLLEKLNILHVIEQNIGELSGGQQQRISIARVLSKKPKLIFADEPTGNLDQETAKEVMSVLFEYVKNTGASLMLVTHDLNLAQQCDNSYELKSQKLHTLK